ncbi:MAG: ankyrin repeat domain-containing protein [Geobacteraceae bacterium]|nr:ankyrin repeat domain-containing protein [Geobacteraceae bacterium]
MNRLVLFTAITICLLFVMQASVALAGELEKNLISAAQSGQADVVCALLEQGANVNGKGPYGDTALNGAINAGRMNIVHMLQSAGASR